MEKVCTRCGKNFDTDSLPEGYSKHKLLSRCKECVYDIDKRKRIKNYLLKKDYSTLTTKEKSFISNYRDINVPILVTDNPKIKENLSKQKVKEQKLQCSLCLRYLSPSRFYYHSNGSFFKKCKTCLKKS